MEYLELYFFRFIISNQLTHYMMSIQKVDQQTII